MKRLFIIVLSLLGLIAVAAPRFGLAANCTVSLGTDTGVAGELRNCITAVATTDGDVVTINPSLTVNLTAQIAIDTSITIQGAGPGSSIIDAGDLDRIFDIGSAATGKTVVITGVTLQNGKALIEGGAIYVRPTAALSLSNCTITSNETDTFGGGIVNFGSLAITNCTISDNHADVDSTGDHGGGIYSQGNLFISNSTITGNDTGVGGGGDGGGINIWNGNAEIRDTTISNNTADDQGGGIFNRNDTSNTIIAGTGDGSLCKITGNTANNSNANNDTGGGIYSSDLMVVDNCLIDNNTANNSGEGGGIYTEQQININKTTLSNNTADGLGGGIFNSGYATLTRSVVTGNHAVNDAGGGIYNDDNMLIENSTVSNNDAQNSNDGGGIYNTEDLIISKSTISGNSAEGNGGGIFNGDDTALDIRNSTIFDNQANGNGGGLFLADSTDEFVNLNNVTIAGNNADADAAGGGSGGGIFNKVDTLVTFNNTIIANNTDDGTGPDCFNDFTGADGVMTSAGPNMITNTTGCETTGVPVINDVPDLAAALANNGGPTQGVGGGSPTLTLALLSTSRAIDAGDNNTCQTDDERGTSRPQGTNCDLGAFEAGPSADLSATSVTFGEQTVGTTSAAQTVTLTNNGTIALSGIAIIITGDFAQTNDCGSSVNPGAFCTITITFGPTATGVRSGSVSVVTSATAAAQLITLLGSGIAAAGGGGGGGGCSLSVGPSAAGNTAALLLTSLAIAGIFLVRKRAHMS